MYQESSKKVLLMLCISTMLCFSQAFEDQGWRKYDTAEGLKDLKSKMQQASDLRSNLITSAPKPERWAYRDQSMTPARWEEWKKAHATRSGDAYFPTSIILIPAIFLVGFLIMFLVRSDYASRTSVGRKPLPGIPAKSSGRSASQCDLVQDALVVLRHCSTSRMDRVMDFSAGVLEAVASCMTKFTSSVRSRQRKKEDDDLDLFELNDSIIESTNQLKKSVISSGQGQIETLQDSDLASFVDELAEEGASAFSFTKALRV